jgi:hypothetical protein
MNNSVPCEAPFRSMTIDRGFSRSPYRAVLIVTELHELAYLHSCDLSTLGKVAPTLVPSESTMYPLFVHFLWG